MSSAARRDTPSDAGVPVEPQSHVASDVGVAEPVEQPRATAGVATGERAATLRPGSGAHGSLESDVARSVGNAIKLGSSLLATWAVALGIRFLLPRYLGPATFGAFQFADSFTTTVFVVTQLGVETYIRKEITTRREHASEFFAGTVLLGVILGALAMAIALPSVAAAGKSDVVIRLIVILGVAQVLSNVNTLLGALLHAVGNVSALSILNVAAKLAWGAGIALVIARQLSVQSVAIVMLAAEALRAVGLAILTRRHVGLQLRLDFRATRAVLSASLPFYLAALATTAYSRIDVSIMSFVANDMEVGWYAAAATIGGISMLLSPLIGWVLLPLSSRAAERSEEELMIVARRAMEAILSAAIPVTLFIAVAAPEIVSLVFGDAFAPATHSLRILAPTLVLTYAAMVNASILVRLELGWRVTAVSVVGMFLAPALNLWLVPRCFAAYGAGGAGIGAAISLVLTEIFTASAMSWPLGKRAVDRRLLTMLGKTVVVALVVIAVDLVCRGLGAWRLLLDGAVYVALVIWWGALDVRAASHYIREAFAKRRGRASAVAS